MALTQTLRSSCATLSIVTSLCIAPVAAAAPEAGPARASTQRAPTPSDAPRIQLALLLDTSSSMDGLIHQAREQLWGIVNTLADARRNGMQPTLEVALYEYGNSGLSEGSGWIRQVLAFTKDLDRVSEALFGLRTNGGDEYCGQVIATAVEDLQWSSGDDTLKVMYIAGNEPFTQGPVDHRAAIARAKQRGIRVNAIHCGGADPDPTWQQGAQLAGGDFFNIDDQQRVAHVAAPQDAEIAELNQKLNQTYLPFGEQGEAGKQRQEAQDANAMASSPALLSKRARSKGSKLYSQESWDLVDAYEKNPEVLESVPATALPEPMAALDRQAKVEYLEQKRAERDALREELDRAVEEREAFVEAKRKEAASESVDRSLGAAVRKSLEDAARAKSFEIEANGDE